MHFCRHFETVELQDFGRFIHSAGCNRVHNCCSAAAYPAGESADSSPAGTGPEPSALGRTNRRVSALLGHFDQFQLSIAGAMQHHDFSFRVAEDKHIAIPKVSFLHSFFQREWVQRDCVR